MPPAVVSLVAHTRVQDRPLSRAAAIHECSCGFCKTGRGRSGKGTKATYGRWLGPFASPTEAQAAAV